MLNKDIISSIFNQQVLYFQIEIERDPIKSGLPGRRTPEPPPASRPWGRRGELLSGLDVTDSSCSGICELKRQMTWAPAHSGCWTGAEWPQGTESGCGSPRHPICRDPGARLPMGWSVSGQGTQVALQPLTSRSRRVASSFALSAHTGSKCGGWALPGDLQAPPHLLPVGFGPPKLACVGLTWAGPCSGPVGYRAL